MENSASQAAGVIPVAVGHNIDTDLASTKTRFTTLMAQFRTSITSAKAQARELAEIGITMFIEHGNLNYCQQLYDELGPDLLAQVDIMMTPLQYVGRARSTGVADAPGLSEELPEGPCAFLGTPVLREDGMLVACCQQDVVLADDHELLHLANLSARSVAELMAQVEDDVYLQTLRVYGPKYIAELAMGRDWGWEPRPYARDHICDLCLHLAAHPGLIKAFRVEHDTPEYRRELALARLALYGEGWPIEAVKAGTEA